jgi:hypothetical protein
MHVRKMILFEELVRPIERGGDLENIFNPCNYKETFKNTYMSCLRLTMLIYACFPKPWACVGFLVYMRGAAVISS